MKSMDDIMELKLFIALMVVDDVTKSNSPTFGFCFKFKTTKGKKIKMRFTELPKWSCLEESNT